MHNDVTRGSTMGTRHTLLYGAGCDVSGCSVTVNAVPAGARGIGALPHPLTHPVTTRHRTVSEITVLAPSCRICKLEDLIKFCN